MLEWEHFAASVSCANDSLKNSGGQNNPRRAARNKQVGVACASGPSQRRDAQARCSNAPLMFAFPSRSDFSALSVSRLRSHQNCVVLVGGASSIEFPSMHADRRGLGTST